MSKECGFPYYPAASNPTYNDAYQSATKFATKSIPKVLKDTKNETVAGYPLSSYVDKKDVGKYALPSYYCFPVTEGRCCITDAYGMCLEK